MSEAITLQPGLTQFECAILDTLRGLKAIYCKGKTRYVFPTQKTLCKLIADNHPWAARERRQLNNALNSLEAKGLIHRVRRTINGRFTSTAYYILEKAATKAAKVARRFFKSAARLVTLFMPYRVQPIAHNVVMENDKHISKDKDEGCGSILKPPQPMSGKEKFRAALLKMKTSRSD